MSALSLLVDGFSYLSKLGVSSATGIALSENIPEPMAVRKAKRIILSNQISFSIALLNLPYVLIYPFMGKGGLGWVEVLLFLGYISVPLLNAKGHTLLARIFLVVLANIDIFIYTIILGTGTGMHFLLLLSGWVPLLLIDLDRRKLLGTSIALSSVLFLSCEAWVPIHGLDSLTNFSERNLFLITLMTTYGIQFLFALYFFKVNRSTEAILVKASDEALAADSAKGKFVVGICEEISRPLQAIFEEEKSLKKLGMTADNLETLAEIHTSTVELSNLVNEINRMPSLTSTRLHHTKAPFSLLDLSETILRPFEFEAADRGISIILDRQGDLPIFVLGDAGRLRQVLRNLLSNALKFTEAGSITFRIRSAPFDTVEFEIEDTGIGIPEAYKNQIFEPFFQSESFSPRKYPGTGLGLFISKQIIEQMGGQIFYQPGIKGGSKFNFSLPLLACNNNGVY